MSQSHSCTPEVSAVSSAEKLAFSHELAIDVLWIDGAPIIHVADTYKEFQNATVLRGEISADLWILFLEICASDYVKRPTVVRIDPESGFKRRASTDLSTAHRKVQRFSGAQSHNSISSGEKYY